MTAFERVVPDVKPDDESIQAATDHLRRCLLEGLMEPNSEMTKQAIGYVGRRLREGLVTDYDPEHGWSTRLAFPWELGHYYRQVVPCDARAVVRELLAMVVDSGPIAVTVMSQGPVRVTDEHMGLWESWLDRQD